MCMLRKLTVCGKFALNFENYQLCVFICKFVYLNKFRKNKIVKFKLKKDMQCPTIHCTKHFRCENTEFSSSTNLNKLAWVWPDNSRKLKKDNCVHQHLQMGFWKILPDFAKTLDADFIDLFFVTSEHIPLTFNVFCESNLARNKTFEAWKLFDFWLKNTAAF